MILKKLEMENFLPFYLHSEIDFSPKGGNKIVLLQGINGAGKSSTFAALNFVFFGAPVMTAEKTEALDLYDLVNTLKIKESEGISLVRVHFTHESQSWSFTRKINFQKIDVTRDPSMSKEEYAEQIKLEKKKKVSPGEFIAVKDGTTITWPTEPRKRDKAIRQLIETIIPKESSKYYFFDGEEISKYTTVPPEDSIKNLIEKLLGVKMIDNAIEDLKELLDTKYDRTIRELGRKNSKSASLVKIAETAKFDLDVIRRNKELLEKEISQLNIELVRYRSQFAGTEKIEKQLLEIDERKKEIKICEENIRSAKKSLIEYNSDKIPILLAVELLNKLLKKSAIASSTLPYIAKTARHYLKGVKCMCERNLDENSTIVLKQLGKETGNPFENFEECSSQLLGTFGTDGLTHRWATLTKELGENMHRLAELKREISEFNADIDIKTENLQEEVKMLRIDQTNAQKLLDGKKEELKTAKQRIETYQKNYEDAQKAIQNSGVGVNMTEFNAYKKRCLQIINALALVKEQVVSQQKSRIEQVSSEILNKIARPEAGLRGIVLDDKYTIMIKRPPKDEPFYTNDSPRPSKGEKQIIAMAFVLALTKFAGIERPIFIDTPFARLDDDYTSKVAACIIDQDEQVVILYQPGEIKNEGIQQFRVRSVSEWIFNKINEEKSIVERVN